MRPILVEQAETQRQVADEMRQIRVTQLLILNEMQELSRRIGQLSKVVDNGSFSTDNPEFKGAG